MIDDKYSTYVDGSKRADVIKLDGHWGCRFYLDNKVIKTEFYKGKSEFWAEDCAENYVLGIKHV